MTSGQNPHKFTYQELLTVTYAMREFCKGPHTAGDAALLAYFDKLLAETVDDDTPHGTIMLAVARVEAKAKP